MSTIVAFHSCPYEVEGHILPPMNTIGLCTVAATHWADSIPATPSDTEPPRVASDVKLLRIYASEDEETGDRGIIPAA